MLLRVFLILSILAGAGIIAITHFKVRPHLQAIIADRNNEKDLKEKAQTQLARTKSDLARTQAALRAETDKLNLATAQLAEALKKIAGLDTQVKNLQANLDKAKSDLLKAKQDLAAWEALGYTVDQIKGVIAHRNKLTNDLAMTQEEYAVLDKAYKKLQELYNRLVGGDPNIEVPLPAGLVGKVLVVDPKWNFVVLDIGQDKEVKQHGVMMVSRDGKLVAKVKIASVEVHRSIANIVPGWKLDDVMEGDLVIGKN